MPLSPGSHRAAFCKAAFCMRMLTRSGRGKALSVVGCQVLQRCPLPLQKQAFTPGSRVASKDTWWVFCEMSPFSNPPTAGSPPKAVQKAQIQSLQRIYLWDSHTLQNKVSIGTTTRGRRECQGLKAPHFIFFSWIVKHLAQLLSGWRGILLCVCVFLSL